MPPSAARQPWRQEERRVPNILWTQYAHCFDTVADHAAFILDVFGRIFGARPKQDRVEIDRPKQDHVEIDRPKYHTSNFRDGIDPTSIATAPVNDAQGSTYSPPRTRSATRAAAKQTPAAPAANTSSSNTPAQTSNSQPTPVISTNKQDAAAAEEEDDNEEPRLPMVHTTHLILRPPLPYPTWDASSSAILLTVPPTTPIYKYGGLAARLSHPTTNTTTDVMLCHVPVCSTCSGTHEPDNNLLPDAEDSPSPFAGKPFVHILRDCSSKRGEGHKFSPPGTGGLPDGTLAEKVLEPRVRFGVGGEERNVRVRSCQAMDCVVCSGEEEVRERREGKERFYREVRERQGKGKGEGGGLIEITSRV